MGNNIELKYSDIDTIIANFNTANQYLNSAYQILGESTDWGSSVMQAFWKFGSKEAIFAGINSARKSIKNENEQNQRLVAYLKTIDGVYENAGKSESSSSSNSNLKDTLIKLGLITYIMPASTFFASVIAPWAAYNIISYIRPKQSASVVTNLATTVTNGVTALQSAVTGSAGIVGSVAHTIDVSGKLNVSQQHVDSSSAVQATNTETAPSVGLTENEYNKLVDTLAKYSNTPYVKNGSSISGVDCSGLVMQVFKETGIKNDFVHKASEIYKQCEPVGSYTKNNVDLSALKKGDLIFYSDGGIDEIGHVGIYMGDGMVMSALNSNDGVQTKSINWTYKNNIYAARIKR